MSIYLLITLQQKKVKYIKKTSCGYGEGLTEDEAVHFQDFPLDVQLFVVYMWSVMPPCGHGRVMNKAMFKTP